MTPTRVITLLLALLACAALPAGAFASGKDVIRDCAQDGDLDESYSQQELDDAYNNLPSDIDEYSDCRSVIEKARERNDSGSNNDAGSDPGAGTSGGSGSGDDGESDLGGSGNDREELSERGDRSQSGDAPDALVGDKDVSGSGGTLGSDSESDGMPGALVLAIILAALAALAGSAYLLREHLPESISSRLPGSLKG